MASPRTHRVLVEPSGSAVYLRAPWGRSLRFQDSDAATAYISASQTSTLWMMPWVLGAGVLKLLGVEVLPLVGVSLIGMLATGLVLSVRLHRRFRGKIEKLSWAESAALDPDAADVPLSSPLHPLKTTGLSFFCIGLGGVIFAFADLDRIARRQGTLASTVITLFAVLAISVGAYLAYVTFNHLRFRWMAKGRDRASNEPPSQKREKL